MSDRDKQSSREFRAYILNEASDAYNDWAHIIDSLDYLIQMIGEEMRTSTKAHQAADLLMWCTKFHITRVHARAIRSLLSYYEPVYDASVAYKSRYNLELADLRDKVFNSYTKAIDMTLDDNEHARSVYATTPIAALLKECMTKINDAQAGIAPLTME